jgi:hypothetical protein
VSCDIILMYFNDKGNNQLKYNNYLK